MSHVTPLSLSKECIVHSRIVCPAGLVMLPSLFLCRPMFKEKKEVYPCSWNRICVSTLSQSYGYVIYKILKLCSKFSVIDVGFIMDLLRRDYSYRHQLIIQKLVLETKFSTLRSVCLNDRLSRYRQRFTSLTFFEIFCWVFDIKTTIHT